MTLLAERFLVDEDDVADLATGESIRLTIDRAVTCTRERVATCDRLFGLRHPLLLPLIDYGVAGEQWFEAHAKLGTLRVPDAQVRSSALHLVRFLRSQGVELDAAGAARHVRAAVHGPPCAWRPIALVLQERAGLEAIRTVLEVTGPPGITRIVVHGVPGSGLRTARLLLARIARLAGYLVMDSRFGALQQAFAVPRHLCVFDWLTNTSTLPAALALAGADGARRHAWIRFCRNPVPGPGTIGLEPLMTREMTNAIYVDVELGPSPAEVRRAVAAAGGNPGTLVDSLAGTRRSSAQPERVHETAPEYVVRSVPVAHVADVRSAGVARLTRAAEAAVALAQRGRHARAIRVLDRCSRALLARGANSAAAEAANHLGEVLLERGKLDAAVTAFRRARECCAEGPAAARALVGSGRALFEQGRLIDAEAALRAAALCGIDAYMKVARRNLAEVLLLRGRLDAAEETVGDLDASLLSTIRRLQGNLADAARASAHAVDTARPSDPRAVCDAHLSAAQVQAVLGDLDAVRRHTDAAQAVARRMRDPALRLRAAAEAYACLERAGAEVSGTTRTRLLRAVSRLPPLAAARVRIALHAPTAADDAIIDTPRDNAHLIHHFRALLNAVHDAPDEASALQAITADLLRSLDACTVVIRSAPLARRVAETGRPWPGEETFTRPVIEGGAAVTSEGLTPQSAEPIVAGGSILGAIAVRWVHGARPPVARTRDLLRTAAAAAAPVLKLLNTPVGREREDDGSYPDGLLGPGEAAQRVRDAIRRAALAPFPVLIEGESGSGKELVARAIHARSSRRMRRLCAVNCAALTDDLLEAELFGHARGAFTGAVSERAGLFEEADQGTIFLDEIGELTARAQAKLLRVLQEGEVRRIGENAARKIDARVVAATNRRLEEEVKAGRFRADLRFRLDVIRIVLPPLRERADDVPWLAQRIWSEAARRVGSRATLGNDVIAALARYDWPGNVRELQNVMASLAVHGPRRGRVPSSLLPAHIARVAGETVAGFEQARLEFERRFVRAALARAGGRRHVAATQLGVSRQGLTKIMKRLGI